MAADAAGSGRPWLASYPPATPARIDPGAYRSVSEIFAQSVERFGPLPAFTNFGATLTYDGVARLARDFAAWLRGPGGLVPGDRVALMMPNLLQYPVALFGALQAGLTVVNVNPLYTSRELGHQLTDSGTRAIVILESFAHVLEECLEGTSVEQIIVTRMGDLLGFPKGAVVNGVVKYVKHMVPAYHLPGSVAWRRVLEEGAGLALEPVDLGPEDLAFLQYTGGTTGVSKGAMLTHRNMVANVLQSHAWLVPYVKEGEEVVVTALPLYHIFALTANCLVFVRCGGHNHLITNPRDSKAFVRTLRGLPFCVITGVNTLFNRLLHTPGFADLDFSRLKISLGGGMAVQRSVAEHWKEVTGCTLVEAYGLTETAPAVCINPLDIEAFNGSIGLPVPSTDCAVRGEDGAFLPVDEVGELCVRGPQVMRGYWQRPEETARCMDEEGWLRTGDIARMDPDGFVYIVDRKKDMVIVSGFNVYPNEVEEVIAEHPGVLEVGVIGVADEGSAEAVRAVVVKKDPGLTAEGVQAWCRERLTAYKCPRSVTFTNELPKSTVGKILRRELRERFGDAEEA